MHPSPSPEKFYPSIVTISMISTADPRTIVVVVGLNRVVVHYGHGPDSDHVSLSVLKLWTRRSTSKTGERLPALS